MTAEKDRHRDQPVGAAAGEDEQGPTVVVRETTGEQLADHVGRLSAVVTVTPMAMPVTPRPPAAISVLT